MLVVPVQDPDPRTPLQEELPAVEEPAEDSLGYRPRRDKKAPGPGPHQRPHQDSGERCSKAVLNFLKRLESSLAQPGTAPIGCVCPLFHPRIMSVRIGRLENIEQRSRAPTGELQNRCFALTLYLRPTTTTGRGGGYGHGGAPQPQSAPPGPGTPQQNQPHWRNALPGASRDHVFRHDNDDSPS